MAGSLGLSSRVGLRLGLQVVPVQGVGGSNPDPQPSVGASILAWDTDAATDTFIQWDDNNGDPQYVEWDI